MSIKKNVAASSYYHQQYKETVRFLETGEIGPVLEADLKQYDEHFTTIERNVTSACIVLVQLIKMMYDEGLQNLKHNYYYLNFFDCFFDISEDTVNVPLYSQFQKEADVMLTKESIMAIGTIKRFCESIKENGEEQNIDKAQDDINAILEQWSLSDIYKNLTIYANRLSTKLLASMQNPSLEQLEMIGGMAFSNYFFDGKKSDIIMSFLKEPTLKEELETIENKATYKFGLGSRVWECRMKYSNIEEMDNMVDDYCKWAIVDQKNQQEAVESIDDALATTHNSLKEENKVIKGEENEVIDLETLRQESTLMERAKEITMGIEKEIEKSLTKEFKRGFQQGFAEGEGQGMRKGKREERLVIAKKMLLDSFPDFAIKQLTGLKQEQLDSLKN